MNKQHGGAREGAGRRYLNGSDPHEGRAAQRVTISIPRAMGEWLEDLGDGNMSAGVRRAVEMAWEMEDNEILE